MKIAMILRLGPPSLGFTTSTSCK